MAAISCHEGAFLPSEAPLGMHQDDILPGMRPIVCSERASRVLHSEDTSFAVENDHRTVRRKTWRDSHGAPALRAVVGVDAGAPTLQGFGGCGAVVAPALRAVVGALLPRRCGTLEDIAAPASRRCGR